MMSIRTLMLASLLLVAPALAQAEGVRVIGDSIGVGVGWAGHVPSNAKISVAIYSGAIMDQLREAQRGETVFLSLGTNDAVGGALDVKAHVQQIVAEADKLGIHLVWIGPPCVLKPWEQYSRKLDGILADELSGTSVKYVSTQDEQFCDARVHAAEGVHFTMAGYGRIWQKAAAAAGISSTTAVASAEPVASGSAHRSKPRRHRHRAHHHAAPAATPETKTEAAPQ